MQKAAEDMKKKQAEEAEAKRKKIEALVGPLQIEGLGKCKKSDLWRACLRPAGSVQIVKHCSLFPAPK